VDWRNGYDRFLWLYGIPGAGKTVLLSYIAEDIKKLCTTQDAGILGWSHYYCYFGRAQEETPHLLRWLINQLCRQSKTIPHEAREIRQQGLQPSTSHLIEILEAVIQPFSRVYVAVDALDESSDREKILDFLLEVIKRPALQKINLLCMSRKERDIEKALSSVTTSVSLSNPYVDEDIRSYVKSRLCQDRKLSTWPAELRAEIEVALVKGAKGM
jgi:Cdc6-like AAA superfamily ATPase